MPTQPASSCAVCGMDMPRLVLSAHLHAVHGWMNSGESEVDETPLSPPADWAPRVPTKVALDVALLHATQQAMEQHWHWKHLSRQRFFDTYLVWAMGNLTLDPPTTTPRRIPLKPLRASLDVSVLREIQRISEQYWNWVHLSPQDSLDTYLAGTIACFSPDPAAPATGGRS